ncbi:MAG: hypothetical protein ABSD70_03295 [Terracidiphilus sp.]|jgi:hypothetical protein
MLTTQKSQTTKDEERYRRAAGEPAADVAERAGLQLLVAELLSENQGLRFENAGLRARAEQLEQEKQGAERGLREATKWAGMML